MGRYGGTTVSDNKGYNSLRMFYYSHHKLMEEESQRSISSTRRKWLLVKQTSGGVDIENVRPDSAEELLFY